MPVPLSDLNTTTQPRTAARVFDRPDVVVRGWYFACRASDLGRGQVQRLQIGRQRLVVFRGDDGAVGCVDAFCPHMGLDLALGSVQGDAIRCHFHHWRTGRDGRCRHQPADEPPWTRAYAVTERYGAVWVYPDAVPDAPLVEVPGLEGKDVIVAFDAVNTSKNPHFVSMVNGLDMAHLGTVHDLSIQMQVDLSETPTRFDATVSGLIPTASLGGRVTSWLLGPRYAYTMRYGEATVAALVLLQQTSFFGRPWPELTMIYAYRPLPDGGSMTQPIFVAERRPGVTGWLRAQALLAAIRVAYRVLEDDDQQIYDNIRFSSARFTPTDAPVAAYVAWVERLRLSDWGAR